MTDADYDRLLRIHLAAAGEQAEHVKTALACEHLGESTGEIGKVLNCGCGAMTTLYRCEMFGKVCAPIPKTARAKMEDGSILLCRDCEHNPATKSTAPHPTPPPAE